MRKTKYIPSPEQAERYVTEAREKRHRLKRERAKILPCFSDLPSGLAEESMLSAKYLRMPL